MSSPNKLSVRDSVFVVIMFMALVGACWYVVYPRGTRIGRSNDNGLPAMKSAPMAPPMPAAAPSKTAPKTEAPKAETPSEPYELIRRADFIRTPRVTSARNDNAQGSEPAPETRSESPTRSSPSFPTGGGGFPSPGGGTPGAGGFSGMGSGTPGAGGFGGMGGGTPGA
ncbi:MAG: hypothetical protein RMK49_18875, partial [Abditibacteriales bacterium]|nr:hypothetical protein [Abditibacteriales bacterium]